MAHDDSYYHAHDLGKFPEIGKNRPELAEKFFDYYGAVFAEGALSAREKALIALAVAHAVQCPYCIDAHTQLAVKHGATDEEIMEAIWVAAEMRAGGAYAHSALALRAIEKARAQPDT